MKENISVSLPPPPSLTIHTMMYEKPAIHRVEHAKDSMNQLSQRGVEQLGTVKYSSRHRGQASSHFSLLHTPAANTHMKRQCQD